MKAAGAFLACENIPLLTLKKVGGAPVKPDFTLIFSQLPQRRTGLHCTTLGIFAKTTAQNHIASNKSMICLVVLFSPREPARAAVVVHGATEHP
jgi:hypothetical protein